VDSCLGVVCTKKWGADSLGPTTHSKLPTHTLRAEPARHSFRLLTHRLALMRTTESVDSPGCCSATLQSPSRWLPRAVVIGLASYGRAYWHRATLARPLNPHPATEAEAVPLCTLAAEGRVTYPRLLTLHKRATPPSISRLVPLVRKSSDNL